jgi:tRNA A-37 threonylcarbamoyl transferase component Bud32
MSRYIPKKSARTRKVEIKEKTVEKKIERKVEKSPPSKHVSKSPQSKTISKSPQKRGKDGTVTLLRKGRVKKTFRRNKNRELIEKEVNFMKKGYRLGVSPKIYEYFSGEDDENPYIVMEELDKTLVDTINRSKGKMSKDHQRQVISILSTLDKNLIFHGDVSPLNFMTGKGEKKDKLYIIDYGMTKDMDEAFIKKHSKDANIKLGITVFILKIREQFPDFHPELLLKKVYDTLDV